jgi:hypothetical protein
LKGNIKLPGPWWWCFVNYGRTPAHLLSYATSLVWVPAGDKINPINLTVGDLPWGFVIPPDGTETAHIDIQPKAATSALAEQKAKETGLVNADASKLEGWLLYPLAIGIYSATYGLLAFASGTTAPKMNLSKAISEKVSIF